MLGGCGQGMDCENGVVGGAVPLVRWEQREQQQQQQARVSQRAAAQRRREAKDLAHGSAMLKMAPPLARRSSATVAKSTMLVRTW